jgi:aryl-alcohol dehydrogenase-like predicted oxidoreductase
MQRRNDGSMFGWSGVVDDESIALIHRAEELGVNLIDTAEGYGGGHSEVITGRAKSGWVTSSTQFRG